MKKTTLILLAAGASERMNGSSKPYIRLNGDKPLFMLTAEHLMAQLTDYCIKILPVIKKGDEPHYLSSIEDSKLPFLPPVIGGQTRAASVLEGLRAIAGEPPEIVIIHDSARAFIPPAVIKDLFCALEEGFDGVAPALPIVDGLKVINSNNNGIESFNKNGLLLVQTPQIFNYQTLMKAFKHSTLDERDELEVLENINGKVKLITGDHRNIKITFPADIAMLSFARTGLGVDSHQFSNGGDFLMLGGVKIPHHCGIEAHSDGDVVLHALCDAVFGALAIGDLGQHFPNNDQWKDANSAKFISYAIEKMNAKNHLLQNADITIICEQPKIAPHREAIEKKLAEFFKVNSSQISVKATTTDGLGLTGKKEGIAAMAIVNLIGGNMAQ